MPLSVPANTSSPTALTAGQRLAGDRGLVDLAETLQHLTVGADPLARTHQDDVADHELGGVDHLLLAGGGQPGRLLRGEVEKRAHRVSGTPGDEGLQRTGGGEDDDQQRALEHLPDRGRQQRRHDHQEVDVEGLLPQGLQAGQGRLPAAGGVAGEVEGPPHRGRCSHQLADRRRRRTGGSPGRPIAPPTSTAPTTTGTGGSCGRRRRGGATSRGRRQGGGHGVPSRERYGRKAGGRAKR